VTKEECMRLITLVVKARGTVNRGGRWPREWVQLAYTDDKVSVTATGPIVGPATGDVRRQVQPEWFGGRIRSPLRWDHPFLRIVTSSNPRIKEDIYEYDPAVEHHLRTLVILEELADQ